MGKIKPYAEMFDCTGHYKTKPRYREIIKLHEMLTQADLFHEFHPAFDGWQMVFYYKGKRIGDVVEHCGSYGSDRDLLEVMGGPLISEEAWGPVEGFLTADQVYQRVVRYLREVK